MPYGMDAFMLGIGMLGTTHNLNYLKDVLHLYRNEDKLSRKFDAQVFCTYVRVWDKFFETRFKITFR